MKKSIAKVPEAPQSAVFPKMIHQLRPNPNAATQGSKPPKRDNTFSQSRDANEDRGSRQIKSSHSTQTLSRGR
jgi:hypothetical protein